MAQKLITADNLNKFNTEVNELLEDGWKVVPGTLSVAVTSTSAANNYVTTHYACSVVVQDRPDEFAAG